MNEDNECTLLGEENAHRMELNTLNLPHDYSISVLSILRARSSKTLLQQTTGSIDGDSLFLRDQLNKFLPTSSPHYRNRSKLCPEVHSLVGNNTQDKKFLIFRTHYNPLKNQELLTQQHSITFHNMSIFRHTAILHCVLFRIPDDQQSPDTEYH